MEHVVEGSRVKKGNRQTRSKENFFNSSNYYYYSFRWWTVRQWLSRDLNQDPPSLVKQRHAIIRELSALTSAERPLALDRLLAHSAQAFLLEEFLFEGVGVPLPRLRRGRERGGTALEIEEPLIKVESVKFAQQFFPRLLFPMVVLCIYNIWSQAAMFS